MLKTLPRSNLTRQISGWKAGQGPSLLLIHGVGLKAEAWGSMLPFLQPYFSLTVIDMPGHGNSDLLKSESPCLSDYTQPIAAVLDHTRSPFFVIGHSMGALIAMDLAIHYPEKICAIAPLNAIFRRSEFAKNAIQRRVNELSGKEIANPQPTLERWFGENPVGALKEAANSCKKMLTDIDPVCYRQAYRVFANEDGPQDEALATIGCPALFITGSEEPNSTPAMSKTLASKVPRGDFKVIDSARHMMPMTHGSQVAELLIDFYAKQVGYDE